MRPLPPNFNVVLTGMPGCGKSTLGILLAKAMTRDFVDTDVVLQSHEHKSLQQIADTVGREGFRDLECKAVCSLSQDNSVIATGGSVVYRDAAMQHLREQGVVVFMEVSLPVLLERLGDLDARGVSRQPGQSIEDLFNERQPLYAKYADITLNLSAMGHDEATEAVKRAVLEATAAG